MADENKINIANCILALVALLMIVLGLKGGILPPILTGVGFIIIAFVFNILKR